MDKRLMTVKKDLNTVLDGLRFGNQMFFFYLPKGTTRRLSGMILGTILDELNEDDPNTLLVTVVENAVYPKDAGSIVE